MANQAAEPELPCEDGDFQEAAMGASAEGVVVPLPTVPHDPVLAEDGALARECPRYCELLREALAIKAGPGFGDVEALDAFRLTGPDNEGRPVFLFIPSHLPEDDSRGEVVEKLTLYVLSVVHEVVVKQGKSFTAIWMCQNMEPSRLSLRWFRRTYYSVPYLYHERLSALCIVHPSATVRVLLFLLSYLPRISFWEKINFADRLEFLDAEVPVALIKTLPQSFKDYDKALDREMYSRPSDPMITGMGAMGSAGGIGSGGLGGGSAGSSSADAVPLAKRNWED